MINAKERFGYTYVITTDKVEQNILGAFCEAKGYWWNCFLGWRRTKVEKDGTETLFYWIPTDKIKVLEFLAKEIKEKA